MYLPGYGLQCLGQFFFIQGFGQIVGHPILKGFLGIFKVSIAAKNDELRLEIAFRNFFNKLQAVDHRHAYIGYNQIRPCAINKLQRIFAIQRLAAHFKAQFLPVYQESQPFQHQRLIIGKHYLKHWHHHLYF
ncbi:hypothetical protein D3C73_1029220 [compost metagenome]